VQPVELDLAAFNEHIPVELFGRTPFPMVTEKPYFFTLSPHAFYWFSMEPRFARGTYLTTKPAAADLEGLPVLSVPEHWLDVVEDRRSKARFELILAGYLPGRRWFGGKAREIKTAEVFEVIAMDPPDRRVVITLVRVEYVQGDPETYVLPLSFADAETARTLWRDYPQLVIARLNIASPPQSGILYDAVGNARSNREILEGLSRRRTFRGARGDLVASITPAFRTLRGPAGTALEPAVSKAEHSNTAILFGDRLFLKVFRRLETGVNPDLEIGRFLSSRRFPHVPPMAGALEYTGRNGDVMSVAILAGFVSDGKDAWDYTLDTLGRFFDRVQSQSPETALPELGPGSLIDYLNETPPPQIPDLVGTYLESARLLGQRTASLHLALASDAESKEFAPESFSPHYQRSLFQSMRSITRENMQLLAKRMDSLPDSIREDAQRVLGLQSTITDRLRTVADRRIPAKRIRCHGDFHLGQVLYTGKDFVFLDFEGEPARSLSERRIKRSSMWDVSGMLRSFHYAAYAGLFRLIEGRSLPPEIQSRCEAWARCWTQWVSLTYLEAYLSDLEGSQLLPPPGEALKTLLDADLLGKAMYELGYELNNRPAWLRIPLQGILQMVNGKP
jgi:maltose alpha-D-glucosyltransferase/alpha-amylase